MGPTGAAPLVESAGAVAVEPSAEASIALPHSAQNLAPGSGTAPQLRQVAWRAWPHSGQKRALGGAADPQLEHVIPSMPSKLPGGLRVASIPSTGGRRMLARRLVPPEAERL